jgi:hypothetical protein
MKHLLMGFKQLIGVWTGRTVSFEKRDFPLLGCIILTHQYRLSLK